MWWVITFSRFGLVLSISWLNQAWSKNPPGASTNGFDGLLPYMSSISFFRAITSAAYWSAPTRVPTPVPLSSFPAFFIEIVASDSIFFLENYFQNWGDPKCYLLLGIKAVDNSEIGIRQPNHTCYCPKDWTCHMSTSIISEN